MIVFNIITFPNSVYQFPVECDSVLLEAAAVPQWGGGCLHCRSACSWGSQKDFRTVCISSHGCKDDDNRNNPEYFPVYSWKEICWFGCQSRKTFPLVCFGTQSIWNECQDAVRVLWRYWVV